MIPWELILSFALGLFLLYLVGWLLLVPMRFLWRLLAGGLLGGFMLWVAGQFGFLFGFTIAVNPFTALIAGFLGIPGVALIIALSIFHLCQTTIYFHLIAWVRNIIIRNICLSRNFQYWLRRWQFSLTIL